MSEDCDNCPERKRLSEVQKENEQLKKEAQLVTPDQNEMRILKERISFCEQTESRRNNKLKAENKRQLQVIGEIAIERDNLQSEVKQAKKDLAKYGNHKSNCAYVQGLHGSAIEDCDCGFTQALKE